jgi:hypothetical protein
VPGGGFHLAVDQHCLECNGYSKKILTLFGVWLDKFVKKEKKLTIAGCATTLWDLWRARNEVCFTERCFIDPANALFLCCFWLE